MPAEKTNPRTDGDSAFGKNSRLINFSSIDLVKRTGANLAGRYCVLVFLTTPPDGQRRVAFLISRRFSRLAVQRNRARRLFREVFRRIHPGLSPVWLLLIPRFPILSAKMQEVLAEVESLLGRAGLWQEPSNRP